MYRVDLDNFVYRWDVLLSNDKQFTVSKPDLCLSTVKDDVAMDAIRKQITEELIKEIKKYPEDVSSVRLPAVPGLKAKYFQTFVS